MRTLLEDFNQASKSLSRRRSYSAVAILILAIGIGAGTAIFSVLDPVLLRPDSFDRERTLAYIFQEMSFGNFSLNSHQPEAVELYETAKNLEGIALYSTDTVALFDGETPERVGSASFDENLLPLLRTAPLIGRNFTAKDRDEPLVLIHEAIWRARFNAAESVLGQTLELNGQAHEIIGVLPSEFAFPYARTRIWTPLSRPEDGWSALNASVVARIKAGTPWDKAQDELAQLSARAQTDEDEMLSGKATFHRHTKDGSDYKTKATLWILFGAVSILLLTACANAANLALTHTTGRRTELSIRRSVGASRGRLIRHLLAESMILSFTAGALGFVFSQMAVPVLLRLAPESIRLSAAKLVTLDWRILVFSILIALLAAALTGIFPAVHGTLAVWSSHRVTGTKSTRRAGTLLATAQVAMAFILLLASGLLFRSFDRLTNIEPGYDPKNVLAIDVNLADQRYPGEVNVLSYYEAVEQKLEQLPFVKATTTATGIPPEFSIRLGLALQAEGKPPLSKDPSMSLPSISIMPDYFSLMRIPLVAGKPFEPNGAWDEQIIISESMVRPLFGDTAAVGQRLRLSDELPWLTVVGVAGEVEQSGPGRHFGNDMEAYFPYNPKHFASRTLLIRTDGDPLARLSDIRQAIWQIDQRVPLHRIRLLEDGWNDIMDKPRFLLEIIGILAILTLLLTLAGMYSVLSYSVAKRKREIGIRLALGAQARSVLWLVLQQGVLAGTLGILVGLGAGRLGGNLLQRQLFEISAGDNVATLTAIALTGLVVIFAAWFPASRATQVEPAETLRSE